MLVVICYCLTITSLRARITLSYTLKDFHFNKLNCLLSHYLSPDDATQWWLSLWLTDESPCICSITLHTGGGSTLKCCPIPSGAHVNRLGCSYRERTPWSSAVGSQSAAMVLVSVQILARLAHFYFLRSRMACSSKTFVDQTQPNQEFEFVGKNYCS